MDNKINQPEFIKINPKRRVLFVVTQAELGGAQKFLSQLLNNLEPEKFECAIVTGPEGNKEIKILLPQNIKYIVSKHLRRNPNIINDVASIFELKKIIKDFQPDTLFLNSSKSGFVGSLAARLLKTKNYKLKTVYRIGGWSFNDPRSWWKNLFYRWLEKISAPWKDYIIVNNKHDYEQAIKYRIKPRKKVALIHNGIDPYKLDFLEKDEAKIRLYELLPPSQKHAGFLHEGLMIGTIANFYPTKGLNILIDAIKMLTTNYQLPQRFRNRAQEIMCPSLRNLRRETTNYTIIGDGPERQNLESRIKNLELENKIFLAGRINDAYKYLPAFDIFVLPSVKEGFPWALLEAMSAKLPIVATAVGANPEIIENDSPSTTLPNGKVVLGKNGFLVPPRDPQALADTIGYLADNESLRREFGIQAHQTVIHNFPLRKMIDQIQEIL